MLLRNRQNLDGSKMLKATILTFSLVYISTYVDAQLSFVSPEDVADTGLLLDIEDGTILGQRSTTVGKGVPYVSFRGIPFAEPPLGDLRFAPPQRNSNWSGILNCTQDRSQCVQQTDPITGSEDCLYINVYTTNITGNLPVLVWIYGGVFYEGNSSYEYFGPDYLLDEEVVYVSFNYRLGVLGFLTTGDLAAPGNWGLKDQVSALEWVQRNIALFGGDPEKVTIFGESAGGASVSYLLQSDKTAGLFRGAIMESGTSLNLWAYSRRGVEAANQIALGLGIVTSNTTKLVNDLRQVDVDDLYRVATTIHLAIFLQNGLEGLVLAPVSEPEHAGALFTGKSYQKLSQGNFQQVPCIIGFNSNEAAVANMVIALIRLYIGGRYDISRRDLAPADLTDSLLRRIAAGEAVKINYMGILVPASLAPAEDILNFINDDQFIRAIREIVLQISKYAPVYMYEFGYTGYLGYQETRDVAGVGHAEELTYLFRRNVNESLVSDADKLTRLRMTRLWANFAKYGNPTPTADDLLQDVIWPAAGTNRSNLNIININANLTLGINPRQANMEFYDNVYNRYGDGNYDTY